MQNPYEVSSIKIDKEKGFYGRFLITLSYPTFLFDKSGKPKNYQAALEIKELNYKKFFNDSFIFTFNDVDASNNDGLIA